MSSETSLKLAFAAALLIVSYAAALAASYALKANKNVFSLGNMMASGILLGAALVHQLPDAQEALSTGDEDEFPWAGFMCGLTFCLFLICEEATHIIIGDHSQDKCDGDNDNYENSNDDDIEYGGANESESEHMLNPHSQPCDSLRHDNGIGRGTLKNETIGVGESNNITSYEHSNLIHHHNDDEPSRDTASKHKTSHNSCQGNHHGTTSSDSHGYLIHHHHSDHIQMHLHGSVTSAIGLLIALSVHSLLEGLGLGFNTTVEATTGTFVAIVAHKAFAAYALGSTLTAAGESITDAFFLGTISIFSFSTPAGIVLALLLESPGGGLGEETLAGIKAVVAGTFLYISIVEVGTKELLTCRVQSGESVLGGGRRLEFLKLFALLAGYGLMSVLAIYT